MGFEAEALEACDRLKLWLLNHAYPIWSTVGVDDRRGGFHEKLGQDGRPVDLPRRARVQPRQIYAFAAASRLGWGGPWRETLRHGLDFYLARYFRPDGLVRTLVAPNGAPLDETAVLYDQAFALFGLGAAHGHAEHPNELEATAVTLRDTLVARLKHPQGGFEESAPRSLPLLSNPHMHLFEAALQWIGEGGDEGWRRLADDIAGLALSRFIEPGCGGLREFFDGDWGPAPGVDGRIVEPGHQYEWAWLLLRWGAASDHPEAIAAALRMIDLAEGHGVDPARGVAMNALLDDLSVHDAEARLWPQTERIKAGTLAAEVTGEARYWGVAAAGARGLMRYLDTSVPGLWLDRLRPDGSFVDEPAPASSFYHIVCAIEVLDAGVRRLTASG